MDPQQPPKFSFKEKKQAENDESAQPLQRKRTKTDPVELEDAGNGKRFSESGSDLEESVGNKLDDMKFLDDDLMNIDAASSFQP